MKKYNVKKPIKAIYANGSYTCSACALCRYLSSHWAKLDVVVHLGMLVVAGDVLLSQFGIMEHQQWTGDVAAALAVPVWARALGVIVPANARLGALLYTLGRMVEEVGERGDCSGGSG
jgi:hypothetical protein